MAVAKAEEGALQGFAAMLVVVVAKKAEDVVGAGFDEGGGRQL